MTRYKSCTLTKFGGNYYNSLQPEKNYKQLELVFFEEKQYYIPKYYDSVLSKLYGDYMKLPPDEKRIGSHGIKCYEIKYN